MTETTADDAPTAGRTSSPFGAPTEVPTRMLVLGMLRSDGLVEAKELYPVAEACGQTVEQVRSCLRRLVAEGLFTRDGEGRDARFQATPDCLRQLGEDLERSRLAFGQDAAGRGWDRQWHLVAFAIPEAKRASRDAFRDQLIALGGAAVQNGLYVSPHPWEKGARDHAERTEYETLAAPFWADDLGSATPPGHWNVIAHDLTRRNRLSVPETARLFALLNLACADAGISCWETKYHYSTWRPETAIREVTKAINPHAVANPNFIPLMGSPAFASFTSGHSTFSSAGSRILERWFRTDDIEFTTTSDGLPGAVRSFKKLSDARKEIGMSRVWGGIHYMSDNLVGQEVGLKLADYVFDNALQPVKK